MTIPTQVYYLDSTLTRLSYQGITFRNCINIRFFCINIHFMFGDKRTFYTHYLECIIYTYYLERVANRAECAFLITRCVCYCLQRLIMSFAGFQGLQQPSTAIYIITRVLRTLYKIAAGLWVSGRREHCFVAFCRFCPLRSDFNPSFCYLGDYNLHGYFQKLLKNRTFFAEKHDFFAKLLARIRFLSYLCIAIKKQRMLT